MANPISFHRFMCVAMRSANLTEALQFVVKERKRLQGLQRQCQPLLCENATHTIQSTCKSFEPLFDDLPLYDEPFRSITTSSSSMADLPTVSPDIRQECLKRKKTLYILRKQLQDLTRRKRKLKRELEARLSTSAEGGLVIIENVEKLELLNSNLTRILTEMNVDLKKRQQVLIRRLLSVLPIRNAGETFTLRGFEVPTGDVLKQRAANCTSQDAWIIGTALGFLCTLLRSTSQILGIPTTRAIEDLASLCCLRVHQPRSLMKGTALMFSVMKTASGEPVEDIGRLDQLLGSGFPILAEAAEGSNDHRQIRFGEFYGPLSAVATLESTPSIIRTGLNSRINLGEETAGTKDGLRWSVLKSISPQAFRRVRTFSRIPEKFRNDSHDSNTVVLVVPNDCHGSTSSSGLSAFFTSLGRRPRRNYLESVLTDSTSVPLHVKGPAEKAKFGQGCATLESCIMNFVDLMCCSMQESKNAIPYSICGNLVSVVSSIDEYAIEESFRKDSSDSPLVSLLEPLYKAAMAFIDG